MTLEIVKDPKLIARIKEERETSELAPFIDLLIERFRGVHVQEIGGTVRDVIISEWYGAPFTLRDWDLIIDDSERDVDLFEYCSDLPGEIGKNHFGNVKWKVNGYEFDVMEYSSRNKEGKPTLERFLKRCDFDIGAIAYCQEHGLILSAGALDAIRNKTITLWHPEEDRPEATIVKAINFEHRLDGFKLSENTLRYIREAYSNDLDLAIFNYVSNYKKMPQSVYTRVMDRLTGIINPQ